MKISKLDQQTINMIAAGEVIERPASVVKELVENAVDAGARTIVVEIEAAGCELVRVSDDGEGMSSRDLRLAVLPHTTSKIQTAADLNSIRTLGFRGEALASIGAVSELSITTRTEANVSGHRLTVEYGCIGEPMESSSPVGTSVTVSNLFANTPARKKFLKKPATEAGLISEIIQHAALAKPGIRFVLSNNGRKQLATPGNNKLEDAIAAVAGLEIAADLLPVNYAQDGYRINGYVAGPNHHRSNRQLQFFVVNERPVANRLLVTAVEKAFHTLLPIHRFPVVFLKLTVPETELDVNVHPGKREVKFARNDNLFKLLFHSTLNALEGTSSSSPVSMMKESIQYSSPVQTYHQQELTLNESSETNAAPVFQVLGQIFSSYLVVATESALVLVDQHAAQERIMYETYVNKLKKGEQASQTVIPVETSLPVHQRHFIQAHLTELAGLGFGIECTDSGIIVRETPMVFNKILSPKDIEKIVTALNEHETVSLVNFQDAALVLMACKAALKANQNLSVHEARQLLLNLGRCDNKTTCPHGRPITISYDRHTLEKMFDRR